ncbi:hypothetical protein ARMGADRAFT_1169343 [Armillaria gallica]|uniref:Uncharacterized protein n=1 Tax=Armillaria gallica TaxID=47427 RepID=A0A2H3D4Y0_ARMGA|nr:hypothetical protein ARMGADRAFT_1169343 [Armillaria gallica]
MSGLWDIEDGHKDYRRAFHNFSEITLEKTAHHSIESIVVSARCLANIKTTSLIMIQSCFWDSPMGIPSLRKMLLAGGLHYRAMVQFCTRRFPNPNATLFPTVTEYTRRLVSKVSDSTKSQPFSFHPAKLSSYCRRRQRGHWSSCLRSAVPSHFGEVTMVDIFSDDGVSTIYCYNIWSIAYFAPHGLTSYTNLSASQDGELMADELD